MHESVLDSVLQAIALDDTVVDRYLAANRGGGQLEPEMRLVRRIFTDALELFCEQVVSNAKAQRLAEAREWIFDENDPEWIFSFESVCEMLDYDPAYWRKLCRAYESRVYESRAPAAYTVRKRGRPAKNKASLDEHGGRGC